MKVVLKQDIKGTGKKDEVVTVSDGYARNFLFPKGIAVEASASALNDVKNKELAKQHKADEDLAAAKNMGEKIFGKTVTAKVKTSPNGKIYGTVTAKDVAEVISKELGVEVDKRKITISDIKNLGSYEVEVKLHTSVNGKVTLSVVAE